MVKRYVVYAANCICDAPPNSDGQYVLVADYDALAARLAEAEREADLYHKAMEALRSTKMKHGLCQPRERMACTHCNAVDKLDAMLIAYKGRRIVASFAGAAVSASVVQYKPCEICTTQSWCETHGCQCYPVSAVQPERCCLDYPRCDCNSPPEPDGAPALQPCGHPWKAQHDSKCILCSSPGVTP